MLTHAQIIAAAGGVTAVRKTLADHGYELKLPTVQSWTVRPDEDGNIPAPHWKAIVGAEIATYDQLASAAQHRARSNDTGASPQVAA